MSPDAQVALNLRLVRLAAWLLPPATLIVLVMALADGDISLTLLASASALTGGVAIWQLSIGRPQALVLNVMAGTALGVMAPFLSHGVSVSLATGLVVLMMTGVPQVPQRWLGAYLWFMGSMWVVHLIIRYLVGGTWPGGIALAYLAQVVFMAFGASAMVSMRRQVANSESRYAYLFANAPVAMWENDFSGVKPWLEALRDRGVQDLRAHLLAHPAELRDGIGRVVTTDANPAAASLLGASDRADLRGPFPVSIVDAESERLFLEQFVAIWEGSGGDELEYTGRRLDGSSFEGLFLFNQTTAEHGLSRLVTAVSDITSLRPTGQDLAGSEITSGALLEALPDLVFLCEADGTYLDYHAAATSEGIQRSTSERD
ncbi:MAG: PAS domain-containing protein, partial [Acidimicrobiia bacterium]|nr:PAS domain-containing protein [Acidimicrobiia bacterium]